MNKVILPKEIAELVEQAWAIQAKHPQVVKHLYLTNWGRLALDHGEILSDKLSDYAEDNPMEYMSALVNGYEVVKTPEEQIGEYYEKMHELAWDRSRSPESRMASAAERNGTERTLDIFGIKIEGINK